MMGEGADPLPAYDAPLAELRRRVVQEQVLEARGAASPASAAALGAVVGHFLEAHCSLTKESAAAHPELAPFAARGWPASVPLLLALRRTAAAAAAASVLASSVPPGAALPDDCSSSVASSFCTAVSVDVADAHDVVTAGGDETGDGDGGDDAAPCDDDEADLSRFSVGNASEGRVGEEEDALRVIYGEAFTSVLSDDSARNDGGGSEGGDDDGAAMLAPGMDAALNASTSTFVSPSQEEGAGFLSYPSRYSHDASPFLSPPVATRFQLTPSVAAPAAEAVLTLSSTPQSLVFASPLNTSGSLLGGLPLLPRWEEVERGTPCQPPPRVSPSSPSSLPPCKEVTPHALHGGEGGDFLREGQNGEVEDARTARAAALAARAHEAQARIRSLALSMASGTSAAAGGAPAGAVAAPLITSTSKAASSVKMLHAPVQRVSEVLRPIGQPLPPVTKVAKAEPAPESSAAAAAAEASRKRASARVRAVRQQTNDARSREAHERTVAAAERMEARDARIAAFLGATSAQGAPTQRLGQPMPPPELPFTGVPAHGPAVADAVPPPLPPCHTSPF